MVVQLILEDALLVHESEVDERIWNSLDCIFGWRNLPLMIESETTQPESVRE